MTAPFYMFSIAGLLLIGILMWALLALPLASAFLEGIKSAHHEPHRVTPEDPWKFFWITVLQKLRRWLIFWSLVFSIFHLIYLISFTGVVNMGRGGFQNLAVFLLNTGILMASSCFILSPFFKNAHILAVVLFPSALFLHGLVTGCGSLGKHQYIACALALLGVQYVARKMGDRWFRFEE